VGPLGGGVWEHRNGHGGNPSTIRPVEAHCGPPSWRTRQGPESSPGGPQEPNSESLFLTNAWIRLFLVIGLLRRTNTLAWCGSKVSVQKGTEMRKLPRAFGRSWSRSSSSSCGQRAAIDRPSDKRLEVSYPGSFLMMMACLGYVVFAHSRRAGRPQLVPAARLSHHLQFTPAQAHGRSHSLRHSGPPEVLELIPGNHHSAKPASRLLFSYLGWFGLQALQFLSASAILNLRERLSSRLRSWPPAPGASF